jgi:hypothetical protein
MNGDTAGKLAIDLLAMLENARMFSRAMERGMLMKKIDLLLRQHKMTMRAAIVLMAAHIEPRALPVVSREGYAKFYYVDGREIPLPLNREIFPSEMYNAIFGVYAELTTWERGVAHTCVITPYPTDKQLRELNDIYGKARLI